MNCIQVSRVPLSTREGIWGQPTQFHKVSHCSHDDQTNANGLAQAEVLSLVS